MIKNIFFDYSESLVNKHYITNILILVCSLLLKIAFDYLSFDTDTFMGTVGYMLTGILLFQPVPVYMLYYSQHHLGQLKHLTAFNVAVMGLYLFNSAPIFVSFVYMFFIAVLYPKESMR